MINLGAIINHPAIAQNYNVQRTTGHFDSGGWIADPIVDIPMRGIISVMTEKELSQVPEGDRVTGAMLFHSVWEIFTTQNHPTRNISDKIRWRGHLYRIIKVWPYGDYGYWKAAGVRMAGD